jgi:hypothetical protein
MEEHHKEEIACGKKKREKPAATTTTNRNERCRRGLERREAHNPQSRENRCSQTNKQTNKKETDEEGKAQSLTCMYKSTERERESHTYTQKEGVLVSSARMKTAPAKKKLSQNHYICIYIVKAHPLLWTTEE